MRTFCIVGLFTASTLVACSKEEEPVHHWKAQAPAKSAAPPGVQIDSAKLGTSTALPARAESPKNAITDAKVALGRRLFEDAKLSAGGDLSCNTCHDVAKWGADGKDFSTGRKGKKLTRNTPSVVTAALESTQFWDGRAETVEDAVKAMLLDPDTMAAPDEGAVVATVQKDSSYVDAFKKAYAGDEPPVTFVGVTQAIGAYLRTLMPTSKWDKFVGGDAAALTDDEKNGFLKFVEVGCPTCHQGPLVGGTMYQLLGKEKPWPNQADKGRLQVTKSPSDSMMFKVPGLRNVEHTAPYFHDASAKTLEEAVKMMADHQLNKQLTDADVASIVTWLETLSSPTPH